MSCKISRRSFLKTSALTAAAVAVAGVATGCSVAPFEPACSADGDKDVQFGDFKIRHISTIFDSNDNIVVAFSVENTSDHDLTIYASDFRASCKANGLGEIKAKEVGFSIDTAASAVLHAGKTDFLNVVFEGVAGKNDYPISVKLHRGTYSLKYLLPDALSALVTPQPYFELVW